jgi:hypothetical protein
MRRQRLLQRLPNFRWQVNGNPTSLGPDPGQLQTIPWQPCRLTLGRQAQQSCTIRFENPFFCCPIADLQNQRTTQ